MKTKQKRSPRVGRREHGWHDISELESQTRYWLHTKRNRRVAVRFAGKLESMLAEVADDQDSIVGWFARGVVAETADQHAIAAAHYKRSLEEVGRLARSTKYGSEQWTFLFDAQFRRRVGAVFVRCIRLFDRLRQRSEADRVEKQARGELKDVLSPRDLTRAMASREIE